MTMWVNKTKYQVNSYLTFCFCFAETMFKFPIHGFPVLENARAVGRILRKNGRWTRFSKERTDHALF